MKLKTVHRNLGADGGLGEFLGTRASLSPTASTIPAAFSTLGNFNAALLSTCSQKWTDAHFCSTCEQFVFVVILERKLIAGCWREPAALIAAAIEFQILFLRVRLNRRNAICIPFVSPETTVNWPKSSHNNSKLLVMRSFSKEAIPRRLLTRAYLTLDNIKNVFFSVFIILTSLHL